MDSRDERLALLLHELTCQRQQGHRPDLDAIARQHPDLVEELRELLTVAQIADDVAQSDRLPWPTTAALPPTSNRPLGALPRMFGDYELLDVLGSGGMGIVYKAWEKPLKRFVALKMILRGEHATSVDLKRFQTEAQAGAGLSHPHIVPVYQVGDCDGHAYFSMKYVEGATLAERIKAGPLPPREAARYLAAIARAIHHAHQHGILHRDLKPSNVLIDVDDQPLVTDFGLAKSAGGASVTGTGAILGTPSYMAPEQAGGSWDGLPQGVGPAADIYSLGAVLYEALTGRPPFLAASPVDTLLLVRSEEPVRPRLLNPRIDPDLELICRKCLEKRPEHRYTTAGALGDDLEAYLKGEPVSARSSSIVYFIGRMFRETHHAPVLENWGVLWMWHSLYLFVLCAVTSWMHWQGFESHSGYLALWGFGLVVWGGIFWWWRKRAGAVTFVERQIAHAWGGGVTASIGVFVIEVLLGLPVLTLSPVLAVVAGVVFLFKAGTLSGWFYIAAIACFAVAVPMAVLDRSLGPLLFGIVSATGFFVPGLKYYRQRRQAGR